MRDSQPRSGGERCALREEQVVLVDCVLVGREKPLHGQEQAADHLVGERLPRELRKRCLRRELFLGGQADTRPEQQRGGRVGQNSVRHGGCCSDELLLAERFSGRLPWVSEKSCVPLRRALRSSLRRRASAPAELVVDIRIGTEAALRLGHA